MGAVCSCKRIEDDEISKILNAMLIKNYQVNIIYNNLIAGIKENKIDHTYYTNFICNLINPIDYRDDHVDYFENINISEDELSCVKRIGIIIIFQSSGPYSDKILFLEKHINKYYTIQNVKEFIYDCVFINTIYCINNFKTISPDNLKIYKNIFNLERIELFVEHIYQRFINLKKEFYNNQTKKHNIILDFLKEVYFDLQGETIRNNLYEDFIKML